MLFRSAAALRAAALLHPFTPRTGALVKALTCWLAAPLPRSPHDFEGLHVGMLAFMHSLDERLVYGCFRVRRQRSGWLARQAQPVPASCTEGCLIAAPARVPAAAGRRAHSRRWHAPPNPAPVAAPAAPAAPRQVTEFALGLDRGFPAAPEFKYHVKVAPLRLFQVRGRPCSFWRLRPACLRASAALSAGGVARRAAHGRR